MTPSTGSDEAANTTAPMAAVVFERLLDALTSMRIKPGDRISVDSIAREFHVSQTPLREALSRLEGEGLVEKQHLKGYRATDQLTPDQLRQLFDVRSILECGSARLAAINATPVHLDHLQSLMRRATPGRHPETYGGFAVLDARFHNEIALASGNRILRANLSQLHVHLHLFRVRFDGVVRGEAVDEHQIILDAIARRDPVVAEAAMASHIKRSWDRIEPRLSAQAERRAV